ncbi:MAG: hypothetical protein AB1749_11565 [Pseudomonadota bacterium]
MATYASGAPQPACPKTGDSAQCAALVAHQLACTRTWTFAWPPQFERYRFEPDLKAFAAWLAEIGETDLPRRKLTSLYAEYCEVNEVRPLPWGRFDRSLKPAGFVRYRTSRPGRPWHYAVDEPSAAIVLRYRRAA